MNDSVFKLLFIQLTESSILHSVPDDSESSQPDQEMAFYRIERIGFQVGLRLIDRLTLGHRLFVDQLDVFKFLCKEYWSVIFKKQIDNLKTNHKVIDLNRFVFLRYILFRVYLYCKIIIFLGSQPLPPTLPCQTQPEQQF